MKFTKKAFLLCGHDFYDGKYEEIIVNEIIVTDTADGNRIPVSHRS